MIDLFAPRGDGRYPPIADLIEAGDCWEWKGQRLANGYPVVSVGRSQAYVYRYIWEALVGPIPDGMELDHLCRNPVCVNPDHLEPVTHRENSLRGYSPLAKNARKSKCLRGHPFRQYKNGRRCLECQQMRRRGEI